jgi:hypothetical protein
MKEGGGGGLVYTYENFKKLSETQQFTKSSLAVHKERCEADLLYGLFMQPEKYVSEIEKLCFDFALKKNSPDLGKSVMFMNYKKKFELMTNDYTLRVYHVLMTMTAIPEIQEIIKRAYTPKNLWGDYAVTHFDNFLEELKKIVQMMCNFHYKEAFAPSIVNDLVHNARKAYLFQV